MSGPTTRWLAAMPALFVLIWSTGFVVARLGMPHAPPIGFLAVRFALSVLCFGVWIALVRAPWPRGRMQWLHLAVTGLLMQAGYLGGVWSAVKAGIGAGTVALIVGLQPVLTAIWIDAAARAGERVGRWQWLGLLLGFGGLAIVVSDRLQGGELSVFNVGMALFALGSITIGTLYQKRHVAPCDVRTASFVQLAAAFAVTAPLALVESGAVEWTGELFVAMAWSVLVLTLGGSSLLYLLIQRGAATQVTSLLYLVPPCTAVMGWLLFRESLGVNVLLGLALTAAGVALIVRPPSRATP
ncbi:MAG TPA: DMT family transporter [Methylibium sp.]|uniref:DMT family transporter n=1 Tax=Methylibium sp. TaxID=2067992 RepID=UPI002DBBE726|nr:DMT family transporter [Methylibium sp.]HEU4460191.1 DMT family transporter [Methylibium sp.]